MATHTYSISWAGTVGAGSSYGTVTVTTSSAFTVPTGQQFKRYKVTMSPNQTKLQLRGDIASVGWDTWTTYTSYISWSSGSTAKVSVYNTNTSGLSVTITVTFETEDLPYTPVTAGNKILATDRSQTGTSTTAGTVMTDSHFTAGTKIEASTFNSQVLGR